MPTTTPAGLAFGLVAPTSDHGWLALGGVLLACVGVVVIVAEWTRRHPNEREPTDEQPDTDEAAD